MSLQLGETVYEPAITTTETSDGNGSAGDAVEIDGSGRVSPTDAAGDDIYGFLHESNDMSNVSAGDQVTVVIFGPVVANAGGSVAKNNIVETSSTAGQVANNTNGKEATGGSFTGTLAPGNPLALSDSGATYKGESLGANEAVVFMR